MSLGPLDRALWRENTNAAYFQKLRDIAADNGLGLRIEYIARTSRKLKSKKPWSLKYSDGTLVASFATLDKLERNLRARAGC